MNASKDPKHMDLVMTVLEQKIEEAELDLTDVQVNDVIMALCKVLVRHAEMGLQLLGRARDVKRGRMSMKRLETWVEEQDGRGDDMHYLERLLLKADLDFEDEAVIAALQVVKEVLTYFAECEVIGLN
jgi:hypothetical protein